MGRAGRRRFPLGPAETGRDIEFFRFLEFVESDDRDRYREVGNGNESSVPLPAKEPPGNERERPVSPRVLQVTRYCLITLPENVNDAGMRHQFEPAIDNAAGFRVFQNHFSLRQAGNEFRCFLPVPSTRQAFEGAAFMSVIIDVIRRFARDDETVLQEDFSQQGSAGTIAAYDQRNLVSI